jgi:hypothetical protein
MKLIILPYSATSNPLGFPGEYPADRRRIEDAEAIPANWIEVTEQEYTRRIETHYQTVSYLTAAAEATAQTADRNRLTAFKQLFQDGRVIDQNWASATAAQKAELSRICFRILWVARTSLAELVKPDES